MSLAVRKRFGFPVWTCLLLTLFAGHVFAQKPDPAGSPPRPPMPSRNDKVTMERSIQVDPGVAIKLCVASGELRINGWNRDEVRIFVKEGRPLAIKPLERSASGKINWIWIARAAPEPGTVSECLAGERIEIDAPVGAGFDLSGGTARTTIDSVKKVKVKVVEGIIRLRNIPGGINAYTSQGDVIVENSSGAISLESTTGNIMAAEVTPGQIGDLFRAKTNSGTVTLQQVDHRQIDANSISGELVFSGRFLSGGIYNFRTSSGSIRLSIPENSSCTVRATYAYGAFTSDLPLKLLTENDSPEVQTIVGKIGAGDASVSLVTSSGSIGIRRKQ